MESLYSLQHLLLFICSVFIFLFSGAKKSHVHDVNHGEGRFSMKIPIDYFGYLHLCCRIYSFFIFRNFRWSSTLQPILISAFSALPVMLALGGIALATYLYKTENKRPQINCCFTGRIIQSGLP